MVIVDATESIPKAVGPKRAVMCPCSWVGLLPEDFGSLGPRKWVCTCGAVNTVGPQVRS